ncbi:exopolysaccharide biosynthesis polyprenyl glycosylphosphotransferase [Aurantiacibacter poecillastricola]|uniref:exopolysaccharide biosynthesis polyprenyl glycosylphosphotransferase n=1 Tax=Aurantiacibacter poecillastricola TaxID=3064385 RepID=UPI00273DDFEE|nr:exopolysaccharide biosynthesis polyprenyl glycosylphosphotransferase [Aurantiacibacter sp. 219JJ12-13]MDP5261850.1 exopolysaccharide biosynthesis polyprenyl glycosylphosphotransferase [Aurantiacibacter sp. 219JJ12-13]
MAAPSELIQDGRSFYRSFLVQVLSCIVLGTLLPPLLYFQAQLSQYSNVTTQNSVIASIIALVAGIFFARRVNIYPGVKQLGSILPTFIASFGAVALSILAFRFEYSNQVLLLNFACCVIVYIGVMSLATKADRTVFYTVPGGRIDRLVNIGLIVSKLSKPSLPPHEGAIIVADLHADLDERWERLLAVAALEGVPVFHFKQVYEAATGKVWVEHLSENSFGSLLPNMTFMRLKRMFDVALVMIALPLLILPLLVVAVLVKLESPGPALFRQERVGFRGRPFKVTKFRTMRAESLSECLEERRAMAMTGENDPRITKLGAFLRRTRIDELPQMFNILLGHMSWIGPRPEAVELGNWYQKEIPFYDYRHIVRPGITGWAQVNQGHVTELEDIDDKLQYDFYYIKNFSYWLDFLILMRTARVVITGHGAK